jgi:hypothetical protein
MKIDINRLNSIPLSEVLSKIMEGKNNICGNLDKWKISNGDNIQVLNEKWYNWNKQNGGFGAISLVQSWLDPDGSIKDVKLRTQAIQILEKYVLMKDLSVELNDNNSLLKKIKI